MKRQTTLKTMSVENFLKTIPYDNIGHTSCTVTIHDNKPKCPFFAYVKTDKETFLKTTNFKNFWSFMQKIDKEANKLKIRVTIKTPLFRKHLTDDFTTFSVGA